MAELRPFIDLRRSNGYFPFGISWRAAWTTDFGFGQPILGGEPSFPQIGRAHVGTPVTNAHRVCRLLLEKKKQYQNTNRNDREISYICIHTDPSNRKV